MSSMPYKFLPDVALADIAFEADSSTLGGLFEASARALSDIMVDRTSVKPKLKRRLALGADDRERLLYDFLTELIVMKDVESLLFKKFDVDVSDDGRSLKASLVGDKIDRKRHHLRNDVKAVTMHMFGIKLAAGRWTATVVLDI